MARRLSPSYQWWRPVIVASIVALGSSALILSSSSAGRGLVVAIILLGWVLYCGSRVLLSRAMIEVDGNILRVRRFRVWHELDGLSVVRVREAMTVRGANFRVCTADNPRGVVVPCTLLHAGHSTLFSWLLTYAPRAELDRGAQRTLKALRQRGLVEENG